MICGMLVLGLPGMLCDGSAFSVQKAEAEAAIAGGPVSGSTDSQAGAVVSPSAHPHQLAATKWAPAPGHTNSYQDCPACKCKCICYAAAEFNGTQPLLSSEGSSRSYAGTPDPPQVAPTPAVPLFKQHV